MRADATSHTHAPAGPPCWARPEHRGPASRSIWGRGCSCAARALAAAALHAAAPARPDSATLDTHSEPGNRTLAPRLAPPHAPARIPLPQPALVPKPHATTRRRPFPPNRFCLRSGFWHMCGAQLCRANKLRSVVKQLPPWLQGPTQNSHCNPDKVFAQFSCHNGDGRAPVALPAWLGALASSGLARMQMPFLISCYLGRMPHPMAGPERAAAAATAAAAAASCCLHGASPAQPTATRSTSTLARMACATYPCYASQLHLPLLQRMCAVPPYRPRLAPQV
jgi:hypothetical protein